MTLITNYFTTMKFMTEAVTVPVQIAIAHNRDLNNRMNTDYQPQLIDDSDRAFHGIIGIAAIVGIFYMCIIYIICSEIMERRTRKNKSQ